MYDAARVYYLLGEPMTHDIVNELIVLNYGLINKQLVKFYLLNDHDALSFAYEALNNAIATYDRKGTTKFSTYATVCIYNKLGSYVRSIRTQKHITTVAYEPIEHYMSSNLHVEDRMMVKAIHDTVRRCYGTLTNTMHRHIISVWIYSDFTMTQVKIAEEVGCSQTYASQVIKHFKCKLEAMLNE